MQLDRWARHIAVRAEYAAVTRQGFEECVASFALVEPLAGIGRHGLKLDVAALGAGQRGLQNGFGRHGAIVAKVQPANPSENRQRCDEDCEHRLVVGMNDCLAESVAMLRLP